MRKKAVSHGAVVCCTCSTHNRKWQHVLPSGDNPKHSHNCLPPSLYTWLFIRTNSEIKGSLHYICTYKVESTCETGEEVKKISINIHLWLFFPLYLYSVINQSNQSLTFTVHCRNLKKSVLPTRKKTKVS